MILCWDLRLSLWIIRFMGCNFSFLYVASIYLSHNWSAYLPTCVFSKHISVWSPTEKKSCMSQRNTFNPMYWSPVTLDSDSKYTNMIIYLISVSKLTISLAIKSDISNKNSLFTAALYHWKQKLFKKKKLIGESCFF